MDLGPVVVARRALILAEEIHRGERRQPKPTHILAHEQTGLDLDHGLGPRPQHEAVCTARASGVEQCVDRELGRRGRRPLDPEFDELGEFLARGKPRIDREPSRGDAVDLTLAQRTEVARAQKDQNFILVLLCVERIVHAKARETEAAHSLRIEFVAAVIEQRRVETNFARGIAAELVDAHGMIEVQARVEERDFERQLGVTPERTVGLEPDVAEVVVVDALQLLGKLDLLRPVGLRRKLLRAMRHFVEVEAKRGPRHQRSEQRDGRGSTVSLRRCDGRHRSRASLSPLNCHRAEAGKKLR